MAHGEFYEYREKLLYLVSTGACFFLKKIDHYVLQELEWPKPYPIDRWISRMFNIML